MPSTLLSPLHRAVRQIGLHLEVQLRGVGVPAGHCHLVSYLAKYAPCRIGELSRVFGIKPSTLTSIVDRLEHDGVLSRAPDPQDGRALLVELTATGHDCAQEIGRHVEGFERALLDRVRPSDLQGFHTVMAAIAAETQVEVRPVHPAPPRN